MKILRNTRTDETYKVDVEVVSRYHDVKSLKKLGIVVPCNELDKFVIDSISEWDKQRLERYPEVII